MGILRSCEEVTKSLNGLGFVLAFSVVSANPALPCSAIRSSMDDHVQKSCWGFMTWTVLTLGGAMLLVYLFGGFDVAAASVAVQ